MANSNNSIITGKLSGSVGKELVFRNWDGKTVVAKAPGARTKPGTANQLQVQDKFLLAAKYAKAILSDPDMKAGYAASLRPRQNAFSKAVADFLSAPVVKSIDTSKYTGVVGNTITIRAVDDFRVTGVQVEIFNAAGASLEKGSAIIQPNGIDWIYTTAQANDTLTGSKIKAVATDLPGNQGTLEITF